MLRSFIPGRRLTSVHLSSAYELGGISAYVRERQVGPVGKVKAALIIGVSLIESNVRTLKCLGPTLHVRSALVLNYRLTHKLTHYRLHFHGNSEHRRTVINVFL